MLEKQYYVTGDFAWCVADLVEGTRHCLRTRLPLEALKRSYCRTLSEEKKGSPDFVKRALSADLRFPVLVMKGSRGAYHLVDGRHRFWKARHLGHLTIAARVIPWEVFKQLPHRPWKPEEFSEQDLFRWG